MGLYGVVRKQWRRMSHAGCFAKHFIIQTVTQVFSLETYHTGDHFILCLDDHQINSRITRFWLQNILAGMCDCVSVTGKVIVSW